jgi:hypothetical protein
MEKALIPGVPTRKTVDPIRYISNHSTDLPAQLPIV